MAAVPPKKPPAQLVQAAIRDLFQPSGRWARERGGNVHDRRVELGIPVVDLTDLCGVRAASIYRVEAGDMVPSDRLRALLAYHLDTRPESIWTYPSRLELELVSAMAKREAES